MFLASKKIILRPGTTFCRAPRRGLAHIRLDRSDLNSDDRSVVAEFTNSMVLQDLGRRINAAVSDLTRSSNLDEKVLRKPPCHESV
jgi:hypothetical protein